MSSTATASAPARVPPTPGAVLLLGNPRAGAGRGRVVAQTIASTLRTAGWDVSATYEPPGGVTVPVRPDVVVIVGGDGTLRSGVERLLTLFPDDPPPVLPVPMGTANLVGQYLGIERGLLKIGVEGARGLAESFSPHQAVRRLPRLRFGRLSLDPQRTARRMLRRLLPPAAEVARVEARRAQQALERMELHPIDIGIANGRLFLLMAGVGFDAHIVHALDARRTGPIGLLSYALPAASAMARYGFPPLRVDVDGRRAFGPKPGVVMIANLPQYGTGFPLVPEARGDDRLLDVLCLPCASRAELGTLLALAADQRHLHVAGAVRMTGALVRVTAAEPIPVQIDGDPGGTLPLEARLHERQIRLIRPAP